MTIRKIREVTFDMDETIVTATLSNANECVLLLSSGVVGRYQINEKISQSLFSVNDVFKYTDGGFDITAPSTIYTLDSIVVVVNDYKTHGYIHYPEKYNSLHLFREDYCASISCYPIALFKNESGVPHIIYSVAWNHVQVMNLNTRQVLTAAKSLIQENAEENHIKFCKTHGEGSKLPWPRRYDYFFGKLHLSPDQKNFLSAGWIWGSYDAYNVYDIDRFVTSNRIAEISIGDWEHCNRGVCWIDNTTVAVPYNPSAEGDKEADALCEIHCYKVGAADSEIYTKIKLRNIDIVNTTIHFNAKQNAFIAFSDNTGIVVISVKGEILFQDEELKPDAYYPDINLFLKVENKTVTSYRISF